VNRTSDSRKKLMNKHGVVPDVVDHFTEQFELQISFDQNHVTGNEISPSHCAKAPSVTHKGDSDSLYALAMVDPDAPSRENHKMREWRHWVVVNIPGNNVSKGDVISAYAGPTPPQGTGLHRYVFMLYKQSKKLSTQHLDDNVRGKWSLKQWAKDQGLGHPVAGNYFLAQRE